MGKTLACSALLFLPATISCHLFADTAEEPVWIEQELDDGPPLRDLMDACVWAVVGSGFPPGERDEVAHSVTSGWDVQLHPYSYKGTRTQSIIEIVERGQRDYTLRVRCRVQVNQEVHKTLEPAAAVWEDSHESEQRARLVLEQLLARVKPRGGRQ